MGWGETSTSSSERAPAELPGRIPGPTGTEIRLLQSAPPESRRVELIKYLDSRDLARPLAPRAGTYRRGARGARAEKGADVGQPLGDAVGKVAGVAGTVQEAVGDAASEQLDVVGLTLARRPGLERRADDRKLLREGCIGVLRELEPRQRLRWRIDGEHRSQPEELRSTQGATAIVKVRPSSKR